MDPLSTIIFTVTGLTLATGGILILVAHHREPPDDDVDPEYPATGIHL